MANMIYTRSEAADIVELFEMVLDKYDTRIPSPEDDEREPDNEAKLYGSTYFNLLDEVEAKIVSLLTRIGEGQNEIVEGVFNADLIADVDLEQVHE